MMDIDHPPLNTSSNYPRIDKSLPRPAPTRAYSWKEYNPKANLLYLRDHERANQELSKLSATVLGFDLEWKPNFYKGHKENRVALVQLAYHDTVLLLQISAMQEFPSKLAEVLAKPDIVKAGVAIQDDALKLYTDYRVSICNCVDLSLFARTVDNARWQGKYNHPLGLARLIESYEYRLLQKGRITRSNWEAVLSEQQQQYASNDAHAGFTLYRKLGTLLPLLPTPPEPEWYTFNAIDGLLCKQDGTEWHPSNPNYDPGPPPPPKLPREVKVSMLITAESSNGEPSATKVCENDNRFQRRKPRRTEQNHLSPSTFQQSPAVASGSTQQVQPRQQRIHEQSFPKASGHTASQHRPTGAQRGSPVQGGPRTAPSSLSSNIRNGCEQAQGYRPPRRRTRHTVLQNASTAISP